MTGADQDEGCDSGPGASNANDEISLRGEYSSATKSAVGGEGDVAWEGLGAVFAFFGVGDRVCLCTVAEVDDDDDDDEGFGLTVETTFFPRR